MSKYKCILRIRDLTQCLCESFRRLTHLAAHSAVLLSCQTSRLLTVHFLIIAQTSKGIRCTPRFLNQMEDFFPPFFIFLRRIVLQHENGRRGTAEKAHSAENIKASQCLSSSLQTDIISKPQSASLQYGWLCSFIFWVCVCVCVFSF